MEQHWKLRASRWTVVLASLVAPLSLSSAGAPHASAATKTPEQGVDIALANAGAKEFVVITMTGTGAAGSYRDVWRSNPNSGTLVESTVHPNGTGHVYVTVLDRVVYEKIDTVQWPYSGLGAKYKSYENKWFILRKSTASYKAFLHQVVIYGALLIPLNGTQFTIQDSTVLHGVKVTGFEGALAGSNPPIPLTLVVSKSKAPLPLEVSVPKTAKNTQNVWTATYSYRTSASPVAKPTTSLFLP